MTRVPLLFVVPIFGLIIATASVTHQEGEEHLDVFIVTNEHVANWGSGLSKVFTSIRSSQGSCKSFLKAG